MAVFVEAGRGRRMWEARKSLSGAVRGSPGRAVQAGIRGIELNSLSSFSRYVRHLDSTIHAIQTKTKLCQLVEAVSVLILVHPAVCNC